MMPRSALRILDPCAPRPYSDTTDLHRLGGTEATVLRIAQGLADDVSVSVEQAARRVTETVKGVRFVPMDLNASAPGTIVVINSWKVALICRRHNPQTRILVWQHVVPGKHLRPMLAGLANAGIGIVCVSRALAAMLRSFATGRMPDLHAIPNPIADDLHPDATPRNRDLLFFASAPHKGLDQVLAAFVDLRETLPSLRLELADPGYLAWDTGAVPAGVTALGTLPHRDVIAKMRQSLCVFYPQTRFAETFGLVLAEANAVGCPVLVHRGLGANDEVVSDADQCIDAGDPDRIAAQIVAWRKTPPKPTLNSQFRATAVLQDWQRLLDNTPAVSLPAHRLEDKSNVA